MKIAWQLFTCQCDPHLTSFQTIFSTGVAFQTTGVCFSLSRYRMAIINSTCGQACNAGLGLVGID